MDFANHPHHEGLLICDFGSQYTLLIARKLRELGVYAEIVDGMLSEPPAHFQYYGIILSGGPDSVGSDGARRMPEWILASGRPLLGICYGMQLLMEHFGGRLRQGSKREYGKALVKLEASPGAFAAKLVANLITIHQVWMSHGDDVEAIPPGFEALAYTDTGVLAGIAHREAPIFGLQYHPEVHHTQHGMDLLENFALRVCAVPTSWQVRSMLAATCEQVRREVGDGHVLLAISGGVDSSVAGALLSHALGPDQVTGVLVDHGLMRKGEVDWVSARLRALGTKLEVLDRQALFLDALAGVHDPEEKRKIIGRTFIEVFEEFARGGHYTHLGQGTLYPDVIESAGHGAGAKVIKSHHNVGGLPEKLALKLIEPFRFLFKDEVRKLGRELGLPEHFIGRHPYPGPGLAVRIPGAVSREKIAILQEADDIFMSSLRMAGLYDQVWQAAAILLPVKSVGVMGDNRTYEWTCVLRAVMAADGMTAEVAELPLSFLTEVASQIVRQVHGINRVLYDVTSKPPATIEWE